MCLLNASPCFHPDVRLTAERGASRKEAKRRNYKSRVGVSFQGKEGEIMLDQIRTIDKKRLILKLGQLSSKDLRVTLSVLEEMFTY